MSLSALQRLVEARKRQEEFAREVDSHLTKEGIGPTYDDRERERKRLHAARVIRERNEIAFVERDKKWEELYQNCRHDLRLWMTEVFKDTTGIRSFGAKQLQAIDTTQQVILQAAGFVTRNPVPT